MVKQGVFQYAIKFVCGISDGTVVALEEYWAAINVHTSTSVPVSFKKKIAIGFSIECPEPILVDTVQENLDSEFGRT